MTGSWEMLLMSWKVLEIFVTKRVETLKTCLQQNRLPLPSVGPRADPGVQAVNP